MLNQQDNALQRLLASQPIPPPGGTPGPNVFGAQKFGVTFNQARPDIVPPMFERPALPAATPGIMAPNLEARSVLPALANTKQNNIAGLQQLKPDFQIPRPQMPANIQTQYTSPRAAPAAVGVAPARSPMAAPAASVGVASARTPVAAPVAAVGAAAARTPVAAPAAVGAAAARSPVAAPAAVGAAAARSPMLTQPITSSSFSTNLLTSSVSPETVKRTFMNTEQLDFPSEFQNIVPTTQSSRSSLFESSSASESSISNDDIESCFSPDDKIILEQINERINSIKMLDIENVCIDKSIITDNLDTILRMVPRLSNSRAITIVQEIVNDALLYIKNLIQTMCIEKEPDVIVVESLPSTTEEEEEELDEEDEILKEIRVLQKENRKLLDEVKKKDKKKPTEETESKNQYVKLCEMIMRTIDYHNKLQKNEGKDYAVQITEFISKIKNVPGLTFGRKFSNKNRELGDIYRAYEEKIQDELEEEDMELLESLEDYYRQKHFNEFILLLQQ